MATKTTSSRLPRYVVSHDGTLYDVLTPCGDTTKVVLTPSFIADVEGSGPIEVIVNVLDRDQFEERIETGEFLRVSRPSAYSPGLGA
jgi:hypothetical protein